MKFIKRNIHPFERVFRILVGATLVSLAFFDPHNLWFLLGLIPLITGFIGWCPPYALFKISTLKNSKN